MIGDDDVPLHFRQTVCIVEYSFKYIARADFEKRFRKILRQRIETRGVAGGYYQVYHFLSIN